MGVSAETQYRNFWLAGVQAEVPLPKNMVGAWKQHLKNSGILGLVRHFEKNMECAFEIQALPCHFYESTIASSVLVERRECFKTEIADYD